MRLEEKDGTDYFYKGDDEYQEMLIRAVEEHINSSFKFRDNLTHEDAAYMAMDCFMLGLRLGKPLGNETGYGSLMFDREYAFLSYIQHLYARSVPPSC